MLFTRHLLRVVIVSGAAAFLWACDDRPEVPEELLSGEVSPSGSDEQSDAPERPTTQQLMQSERVGIQLDTLPLRIKAPPQWHIGRTGTAGNIVLLQGPTPHSEVQIQLKERDPVPMASNAYAGLLTAAKREEPDGEDNLEYREVGPMIIIERHGERRPMSIPVVDALGTPKLDANQEPMIEQVTPVGWTWTILVPQDDVAEWYELNFLALTKEQLAVDREFLESILSTLQYTGATISTTTTQPAAAPTTQPETP